MTRPLAPAALLALTLAACGGDTCSTAAAQVNPVGAGCTLAPNTTVTINVRLCPKCTDTSPTCQGEVVGTDIQIAPVVNQCAANQGCDITQACQIAPVPCPVNAALAAGSYTATYETAGGGLASTPVTVQAGGSTSCTL
jgi:hypothetical protein